MARRRDPRLPRRRRALRSGTVLCLDHEKLLILVMVHMERRGVPASRVPQPHADAAIRSLSGQLHVDPATAPPHGLRASRREATHRLLGVHRGHDPISFPSRVCPNRRLTRGTLSERWWHSCAALLVARRRDATRLRGDTCNDVSAVLGDDVGGRACVRARVARAQRLTIVKVAVRGLEVGPLLMRAVIVAR